LKRPSPIFQTSDAKAGFKRFRAPARQVASRLEIFDKGSRDMAAEIRLQTPADVPALEHLDEETFGPGRFARTAYRVRDGAVTEPLLNLCALDDGKIIGSIQFTPIAIGGTAGALLLGPLVIERGHANQGHGLRLMLEGIKRGRELGYKLIILVGDLPYYARAGFAVVPFQQIVLPGPVDPARLLYRELAPNALADFRGLVRGSDAGRTGQ
jgi:predicted N-acetyltransferase YhbS